MKDSEPCPCGSGKPQITCCGSAARSRMNLRLVVTWCLILLAAVGITAITVILPSQRSPETAGGSTPQPYEYDSVTNRHWDPATGHWHPGPPPSGATTAPSLAGATTAPSLAGATAQGSTIQNPQPWQYDPVTDQHWHAGPNHWDPGPPPSGATTAPSLGGATTQRSTIQNPQPWQYDPATNQHWHAGPDHWDPGPPPSDPGSSTSGSEVPAPPNSPNPQPWQYDAATDRHYDPNHTHWHSGPPPADKPSPEG